MGNALQHDVPPALRAALREAIDSPQSRASVIADAHHERAFPDLPELLVAIEAALALCYHVSAKRLRKVPEEYAECFGMLRDAGILPPELAGRLQQMARFRNLLVHMYWKIDYGQVFDVLQHNHAFIRGLNGWQFVRMDDPDGNQAVFTKYG